MNNNEEIEITAYSYETLKNGNLVSKARVSKPPPGPKHKYQNVEALFSTSNILQLIEKRIQELDEEIKNSVVSTLEKEYKFRKRELEDLKEKFKQGDKL